MDELVILILCLTANIYNHPQYCNILTIRRQSLLRSPVFFAIFVAYFIPKLHD